MTTNGWLQIGLYFFLILVLAKPVGTYLTVVFERRCTWLDPVLNPIERILYAATGVHPDEEMRWTEYLVSMLMFSAVTALLTYFVERLQLHLPWNPQALKSIDPDLAWNTAISFTTNNN